MPYLTADRLREILDYGPETGIFRWKTPRPKVRVGTVAGRVNDRGYVVIRIDGRLYRAGRLAWLYVTGSWPTHEIDHANGASDDDRWANLREATRAQNSANTRGYGKSGFKGTCRRGKKWQARIKVDHKSIYLGTFASPEEANAAYTAAAQKHFGPYSRGV